MTDSRGDSARNDGEPSEISALAQDELARLSAHRLFRKSQVLRRLLAFLVEAELQQRLVTESSLAQAFLGLNEEEFHPYTNSYIRVNTSQLRRRLAAYYREKPPSRIRVHLPQGSFRLRIDIVDWSQERWRRAFGQAKLMAAARYVDELELALQRIDEVTVAQPDFAPAYALKSLTHLFIGSHGGSPLDQIAPARQAADRAMALAPNAWGSLAAAASIAALFDWNWAQANRLYERAAAVPGNELVADPWYQAYLVAIGHIDPCLTQMRQALIDYPTPPRGLQQNYGIVLHLARRWDEAEAEMAQTVEVYPDDYGAWLWRAMQAIVLGSHVKASHCLLKAAIVTRGRMPGTLIQTARDFLLTGKYLPSPAAPGSAVEVSKLIVSAMTNHPESAIDSLERMVEARNVLAPILLRAPLQSYLHHYPRFRALFKYMGIPHPANI